MRSTQFVRFLLVGGFAAAVNVGSRVFYDFWTSYAVAIVLAYLTGLITAFLLTRTYVFPRGQNGFGRSAFKFTMVNGVAVLQTWAVSIFLAKYALPSLGLRHFVHEVAHMVGVAVPIFTSYVGHKRWSFR